MHNKHRGGRTNFAPQASINMIDEAYLESMRCDALSSGTAGRWLLRAASLYQPWVVVRSVVLE